jgi:hypothetical protein
MMGATYITNGTYEKYIARKFEGKLTLERPRNRQEDNIKMDQRNRVWTVFN